MAFAGEERFPVYGLESRGRHATFSSAVAAAGGELEELIASHPFDRTIAENFKRLFPNVPAWPGKYDPDSGYFQIMVKNSAGMFFLKPQLRKMTAALKELPGCPKGFKVALQIAIR